MDLRRFRRSHLAWAELVNAWRIIPRIMIVAYMWLVYHLVEWYMTLEHYIIKGCVSGDVSMCIGKAPSLEHAALITAIIGAAAIIFAFYTRSGNVHTVPDTTEDRERIKELRNRISKETSKFPNKPRTYEPSKFPNRSDIDIDDNY